MLVMSDMSRRHVDPEVWSLSRISGCCDPISSLISMVNVTTMEKYGKSSLALSVFRCFYGSCHLPLFIMIYHHIWSIWKSFRPHHRPTLWRMAVNIWGWFKKWEERLSFSQVHRLDYFPIMGTSQYHVCLQKGSIGKAGCRVRVLGRDKHGEV